jgi:hypothetical protein
MSSYYKKSYNEIILEKIKEFDMKIATTLQKEKVENYLSLNKNKDKTYGIVDDTLFIFYKDNLYCRDLPLVCDGEQVLTHKQRWKTVADWSKNEKHNIYKGIHIFINEELAKIVSDTAKERAKYKETEHRKGDNYKDARRVETGNTGEMAFEIFSSTKTTDFSSASSDSSKFEVVDNNELGLGVKSGRPHIATQVIKTTTTDDELLMVLAREDKLKNRVGKHVICRGVVNNKTLHNTQYLTRNTLIDDSLLAKSLFFSTKIGAKFGQESLTLFYSLNRINRNPKNNKIYTGKNLVIDKNVDFSNLTPSFISKFEESTKSANTTIIYIDVTSLGFINFNDFVINYLHTENSQIIGLEQFAAKYGVGVVFYDETTVWNYKTQNVLSYKIDPYLIGKLFANGDMICVNRRLNKVG